MNFSMKIIKPLISYSLLALSIFTTQISIAKDFAEKIAKEQAISSSSSLYLTMRDGVKIAIDVQLSTR